MRRVVSRRLKYRIHKKLIRLAYSSLILGILVVIYLSQWIIRNAADLYPVRAANAPMREVEIVEKPVEVITEVEVDRTFTTEKQQIMAYIVEVFGDDAADAITVINKCENHAFNPKATNHNRNGTVDRGIFQLNSAYWGGEELYDWKKNVDVAYMVFTRAGKKWTPWTCATVIGQNNYLGH